MKRQTSSHGVSAVRRTSSVHVSILVAGSSLIATTAWPACIDISKTKSIDAAGALARPVFPGPPGYEDVRRGDTPEPTYILKLDKPFCVIGDDFVGDGQIVDRIHLVDNETTPQLKGLVGREINVNGADPYGGLTGHHRAPLVMSVIAAAPVTGADEPMNGGMTTVQAFYLALETGDGHAAAQNVIPSKRAKGPLSAERLTAFYGSLDVPLKLEGVERTSPGRLRARYRFTARGGKACNGGAIVSVENSGGLNLISGIRSLSGC